ncbi:MAG TPA: hypothetical protein VGG25_25460 [Streptosporangiaceae bacterium]|jgi:hypothetical protein
MSKYTWPVTVMVVAVILVAGAVVVALILRGSPGSGTAGSAVSASAAASATASAASPPPATEQAAPLEEVKVCTAPAVACTGEMRTEPAQIGLSADGSGYLTSLVWSGWGTATATAAGTLQVNNCQPNCAQGSFSGYPAMVRATGLTHLGSGLLAYADVSVSAPSAPSSIRSSRYTRLLPRP